MSDIGAKKAGMNCSDHRWPDRRLPAPATRFPLPVLVLLFTIATLGGLLSGCLAMSEPDVLTAPAITTPVAVGTVAALPGGAWELTVSKVERAPSLSIGVINKPAEGEFVAVTVAIRNTSKASAALDPKPFRLVDATGRSYQPAYALRFFGERLQAQRIEDGRLIFDVPAGVGALTLTAGPGYQVALGELAAIPKARIQTQQ